MENDNNEQKALSEIDDSIDPEIVEDAPSSINGNNLLGKSFKYSGPLPPAAEMERYAQIDINLVNRIVSMAEREAAHRHEMDIKEMDHIAEDTRRGQKYGLSIGLGGLLVSAFALHIGSPWIGGILGSGTLAILVTAFIKGR